MANAVQKIAAFLLLAVILFLIFQIPIETSGQSGKIPLLAVDRSGNGTILHLEIREVGRTSGFAYSKNPPCDQISDETGQSFLMALDAVKIRGAEFCILGSEDLVGGKSAGAAAAILLASLTSNRKIRNDTIVTGSIDENGSIGSVGKVLEKAVAAKNFGFKRLVVAKGEAEVEITPIECKNTGSIKANCLPKYEKINVGDYAGIKIIEVSTLKEAEMEMFE